MVSRQQVLIATIAQKSQTLKSLRPSNLDMHKLTNRKKKQKKKIACIPPM